MAYMTADTAAKIGFRPYYQTDAFGAAHLSGYGSGVSTLGQQHPFKPQAWHLHGMGAYEMNRPFDPWELHNNGVSGWGLGDLGDTTDPIASAADELLAAGQITQAEHDAIYDGSMSFQDVTGIDPTDQGSWTGFVGSLRDWNSSLQSLESQYAAAAPPIGTPGSPAFVQLGQDLATHRQQYTGIASQFVQYYTLLMGSAPSGLSGLGIAIVVYWAAGAAVFLVTAYLAYQGFKTWQAGVNVKQIAASSTAATNAAVVSVLQKAQASGDTVTANAALSTLQKTAASGTASAGEQWLMNNWQYLALGAGALIAIGPISQGLFGGGRRR